MVTNFYITQDGFFRGNGLIPFLTKELGDEKISFRNAFQEVIQDIKRLHDVYILSMIDDGKITGRERIQLCKEMDFLIGDLILLRLLLNPDREKFTIQIHNYALHLTFKIIKARWEGFGHMGHVKSLGLKKLRDWITKNYSVKVKRLVSYTNLALSNDRIDSHESEVLSHYIEKLILGLVVARNDIYTAKVS